MSRRGFSVRRDQPARGGGGNPDDGDERGEGHDSGKDFPADPYAAGRRELHVAQAKSFRAAQAEEELPRKEDAAAYDARQRRMCEGGER
jgi:hypothetical protein